MPHQRSALTINGVVRSVGFETFTLALIFLNAFLVGTHFRNGGIKGFHTIAVYPLHQQMSKGNFSFPIPLQTFPETQTIRTGV